MLFALPGAAISVHAHLCGTGNTYNSQTFQPAAGKYAEVTAVACGAGSPNFTTETHKAQCTTSSPSTDWSFGSGYYEYYAYDRLGHLVYDHLTNINGSCPYTSTTYSNTVYSIVTDFQLTVTYLPTNNSTTLFAEATDCAASSCPN
jgi:hypothetical protein